MALIVPTLIVCLLAGTAYAIPTTFGPANGEPTLEFLLAELYGAGNFVRVDDAFDTLWESTGETTVTARAKYAAWGETFGFMADTPGAAPVMLFSITGYAELSVNETASFLASRFRFVDDPTALNPANNPPMWTSDPTLNADGLDHLVTYLITGGASKGNYVIGFEDKTGLRNSDRDFNDLVVEVHAARVAAPEPPSLLLLGLAVAVVAAVTLRRQHRRAAGR